MGSTSRVGEASDIFKRLLLRLHTGWAKECRLLYNFSYGSSYLSHSHSGIEDAKKLLALIVVLGLLLISASPAGAATGLDITASTAEIAFPDSLTFSVAATGPAAVNDIRLHYVIEHTGFASITSEVAVVFSPGEKVTASWTLEMVKLGGLPPGTVVEYWWTVSNAGGGKVDSVKNTVEFTDQRYDWKSRSEGIITLYWYEGSDAFASSLITAAKDALKRLADQTGAVPERPVRLYIYSGTGDLRGALINPQEWTGGVNYARYSIIALGIAPGDLGWGVSAIAHELTHQVVNQVMANPYGGLPTWLEEGLAVHNEVPPAQDYQGIVANAVSARNLISLRSLASPFSAYGDTAYLSYAESYDVVRYLINRYGEGKMLKLLETFRTGETYDGAMQRVYGFDTDGLNREWQATLTGAAEPGASKGNIVKSPRDWFCRDFNSTILAFSGSGH